MLTGMYASHLHIPAK